IRLLNTATLKVKEFVSERPKYAILSYTWGSEKIILQDTEAGDWAASSIKARWNKIKGACALALGDGFGWIWIDTCCIDKSSSSELSEAINSMFRWYREAEICYAYLEDVPPLRYAPLIGFLNLAPDLDSNHVTSIKKDQDAFLRSRWLKSEHPHSTTPPPPPPPPYLASESPPRPGLQICYPPQKGTGCFPPGPVG
ncbi:heterokaryon incompatibility protein, partial [Colletotrichum cuscutae]